MKDNNENLSNEAAESVSGGIKWPWSSDKDEEKIPKPPKYIKDIQGRRYRTRDEWSALYNRVESEYGDKAFLYMQKWGIARPL